MRNIDIKVHPEKECLPKEKQVAYMMAEVAAKNTIIEKDTLDMVGNRIIDNASVAIASLNRAPVRSARLQALAHPRKNGAQLFGLGTHLKVHAEWATWANNTAVRELDYHDTFLAADYSHPGDNIPALQAVAEQLGINGKRLTLGILTAYEVQVNLVKAICLHEHKIDHVAHLAPAVAAGIGTMLQLDVDTIYQAINQAEHISIATRQSRKGEISSWKAFAPGHAAKLAVEAVDRAMRGEKAPSPMWEGEDSVVAWVLDGKDAHYVLPFPNVGEPCRVILETYTKEHSAEYQAQALIDLACDLNTKIENLADIQEIIIHTSHHTHYVIGTGSGDPQKFDPKSSRETLDHSIMYIFAVALEDARWHHVDSYAPERANRPETIALWNKIRTVEDGEWTKKYHDSDPNKKCFGARVEVKMNDGSVVVGEKKRANAHPAGDRPFKRNDYKGKFRTLTKNIVSEQECNRFFDSIERLDTLSAIEVQGLIPQVSLSHIDGVEKDSKGIF